MARQDKKNSKSGVIGVIDIGSSKICALVARPNEQGELEVRGMGYQASFGIRAGTIANMDAAESAIGAAVEAAEQAAGETLRSVIVNFSGGQPTSSTIEVTVSASGGPINDTVLRRVAQQCRAALVEIEGDPLHIIPTGYTLDGARGIRDPRGMVGDQLEAQLHAVTANSAAVRNLITCVERCHLEVQQLCTSPLAAGLATLAEDEVELGATLIDLGGGTTTIGVFSEGEMVFSDAIPIGGIHITNDIARGLTTPTAHAERMKILYGHAMSSATDKHQLIDVPQVGENEADVIAQVPRSLLIGIIQPRLEEVFEMVRARLEHSGFDKVGGRRVVLTGGVSQMAGVRELAQLILDRQVRIGKPLAFRGLPESAMNPAFSVATGLLIYATQPNREFRVLRASDTSRSLLGRLGEWFRENV